MDTVVSSDGTAIAYERTGDGPPLVLIHGTGRDRSQWMRSLPELTRQATVYAIDRRGRGQSGDTDRYAIERDVEDVLALIAAIDEPLYLLGHSYGAIIAMEAALRTDRLDGLILYEPPLSVGPDRGPSPLGDKLEALMATGDREAVLVTFLQEGPRYPPEVIAAQQARPDWSYRLTFAHTLPREAQMVERYVFEPERVANLWEPLDDDRDFGAHGPFDDRSHSTSPQFWLTKYRSAVTTAGLATVALAGALLRRER